MAREPSISEQARNAAGIGNASGFDPSKAKIAKRVTVPQLKVTAETPLYIYFQTPIYKGREVRCTQEGQQMAPADLARVVDLMTNNLCEIIIGTVWHARLIDSYPNQAYVGKAFAVVQHKVEGKRYKTYEITEIEVPDTLPADMRKTSAPPVA